MRPLELYVILLSQLTIAEYVCPAAECVSPYDEFPVLLSNELWNSRILHPAYISGNFTHPLPVNGNTSDPSNTDFSRNERVFIGDGYHIQWMQNTTRNGIWELYIINEHYEKLFLHGPLQSPSVNNTSLSGYMWPVKEDSFLHAGSMYFFYVARKDGFWSEGFASRFVNISRPEQRVSMLLNKASSTAAAGFQPPGNSQLGVILLVFFGIVFGF